MPAGLAIFGFAAEWRTGLRAAVPASKTLTTGRVYAEVNGPVNTGIAIVNPNDQDVTVTLSGSCPQHSFPIPANQKIAAFLSEPPFNCGNSVQGAVTLSASAPVCDDCVAWICERASRIPGDHTSCIDIGAATSSAPVIFPHFADGAGWTTQIVLVNPTDSPISGNIQFLTPGSDSVRQQLFSLNGNWSNRQFLSYLSTPPALQVADRLVWTV